MSQVNNNSHQKSREIASTDNVFLRILLIQFLWIKLSFQIWFTVQKVRLEVHLILKLPQAQLICGCSWEDQFCNCLIFRHVILYTYCISNIRRKTTISVNAIALLFWSELLLAWLIYFWSNFEEFEMIAWFIFSDQNSKNSDLQNKKYVGSTYIWSWNGLMPKRSVASVERISFAIFWPSDMSFCTIIYSVGTTLEQNWYWKILTKYQ